MNICNVPNLTYKDLSAFKFWADNYISITHNLSLSSNSIYKYVIIVIYNV